MRTNARVLCEWVAWGTSRLKYESNNSFAFDEKKKKKMNHALATRISWMFFVCLWHILLKKCAHFCSRDCSIRDISKALFWLTILVLYLASVSAFILNQSLFMTIKPFVHMCYLFANIKSVVRQEWINKKGIKFQSFSCAVSVMHFFEGLLIGFYWRRICILIFSCRFQIQRIVAQLNISMDFTHETHRWIHANAIKHTNPCIRIMRLT